jgi:flagellum-specific ATP synthase
MAAEVVRHLAVLERNRQLVELGAYVPGSNPGLDAALSVESGLFAWLRQDVGGADRTDALTALSQLLQKVAA